MPGGGWVRGRGDLVVIASRYSMYSILMLIFCYSFLARYLPRPLDPLSTGRAFT